MKAHARTLDTRAAGTVVDPAVRLPFTFDGVAMEGVAGDTIASALLANGVRLVARSFKLHRPRGIVGAGAEDPAGLVTVGEEARAVPNVRAAEADLEAGMVVRSQNAWPSLRRDAGAVNDVLHAVLPAGFYYKAFLHKPLAWMRVEPFIRAAAGLGRVPEAPDPDRYEHVNLHVDIAVVGAGAAGLAAATAAARSGARVLLAETSARLGGWLLSAPETRIDGAPAAAFIDAAAATLARHGATVLTRTTAFGYHTDNFLLMAERASAGVRERLWRVRAREVVLATGMLGRLVPFPGNDRPGVMLASAAVTYARRYGVPPGRRAAVLMADDTGHDTAAALAEAGVEIAATVDLRNGESIVGTRGRHALSGVTIRRPGWEERGDERVDCDILAVAGGFVPNASLFAQSRGLLAFDPALRALKPALSHQRERSAGGAAGVFGIAAALAEGARAGAEAARAAGYSAAEPPTFAVEADERAPGTVAIVEPPISPTAFLDLQNDVTTADVALAVREGYAAPEHLKRYTTGGMGTDQGKTSNPLIAATLAAISGRAPTGLVPTTARPPYTPVTFGTLAGTFRGRAFAAERTTPMHDWHLANGAVFEPVGEWLRPFAYPRAGESVEAAVARESLAVRRAAGVLDATTLGKIDVRGPDARTFLDRIAMTKLGTLKPGRSRYVILLGEDGMVKDDGIVTCLADDHFHMTTTTGGAAGVLAHMEDYLQTEWPHLSVFLTSVTEAWAVAAVSGPAAGAVIERVLGAVPEVPPLGFAPARLGNVPVRLFRQSFTGVDGWEINAPAPYGLSVWERVVAAGATPYGTEAMHLLRAEAGYPIIGQDTDGTVTGPDLGFPANKETDFVGRRSLSRPDTARTDRRHFVGLRSEVPLAEGAHILAGNRLTPPVTPTEGHVTSAYVSPAFGRPVSLALLARGRERMGETVWVSVPAGGAPVAATVVPIRAPELDTATEAEPLPPAPPAGPMLRRMPMDALSLAGDTATLRAVDLAPIVLRVGREEAAAVEQALGVPLPEPLGASVGRPEHGPAHGTELAILWRGPDEWLILADPARREAVSGELDAALAAAHRQIVDQSGALVVLALGGDVEGVLARLMPLDLTQLQPGRTAGTLLARTPATLHRRSPTDCTVVVRASFARHVAAHIAAAAPGMAAPPEPIRRMAPLG
jgi:sarcosine oxidase subunit alpha